MESRPTRRKVAMLRMELRQLADEAVAGIAADALAEEAFWHASFSVPIGVSSAAWRILRRVRLDDDGDVFECHCWIGRERGSFTCRQHRGAEGAEARPIWQIDLLGYELRRRNQGILADYPPLDEVNGPR